MVDGTQRSRAGLSSVGPPGLGPRLCRARGCRGVFGSNRGFPCEFSIPMPIPIPIPTRGARGCRSGGSYAGGLSCWDVAEGQGIPGKGSGTYEGGCVRVAISLLSGLAAYPVRVPGSFRALVTRLHVGGRAGRGSVAPAGAGCAWVDGTQRSRAGLSSVGPPGLGPGGRARVAWIGFVSLVSFVVEQRWRVEPRSAQRARTERESGPGADRMTGWRKCRPRAPTRRSLQFEASAG
jgi:hypothetical protein